MGGHLSIGHPLLPGHQPDHHVREVHLGLRAQECQACLSGRYQGLIPTRVSSAHLGEHGVEAVQPALCGGHHVPGGRLLGLLGQFLQKEAAELPPVLVQVGGFGLTGHAGQRPPVARTGRAGAGLSPSPLLTTPPSLSVLPRPESLPYWLTQLTSPLRPSWLEQLVDLVDRPADAECRPGEWDRALPALLRKHTHCGSGPGFSYSCPVLPAPAVCQARAQDLLADRGVSCETGANQTRGGGDLSGL